MTVRELIEALRALPQDAVVVTQNADVMGYADAFQPKIVNVYDGSIYAMSPYLPADDATPREREGEPFDAVLIY